MHDAQIGRDQHLDSTDHVPVSDSVTSTTSVRREASTTARVVGKIVGWIRNGRLSPGDLAELRRQRPGTLGGAAYWKIAAQILEPEGAIADADTPWRGQQDRTWTAILKVLAMAESNGRTLHRHDARLGRAFERAGVSEARVMRLLDATDDALIDLTVQAVHQLVHAGRPFNVAEVADLLLSDGGASQTWRESVRQAVARHYFNQQANREAERPPTAAS